MNTTLRRHAHCPLRWNTDSLSHGVDSMLCVVVLCARECARERAVALFLHRQVFRAAISRRFVENKILKVKLEIEMACFEF